MNLRWKINNLITNYQAKIGQLREEKDSDEITDDCQELEARISTFEYVIDDLEGITKEYDSRFDGVDSGRDL